jgi:hypothetical protein
MVLHESHTQHTLNRLLLVSICTMAPASDRANACSAFAVFYCQALSGDAVDDAVIQSKADEWQVDISTYKTKTEKIDAIVRTVGEYYWSRHAEAHKHYTSMDGKKNKKSGKSEKDVYIEQRMTAAMRDPKKLTSAELREFMADKDMIKPVSALQNVFTPARKKLQELGMTWWQAYLHTKKTQELRAQQADIIESDRKRGTVKDDIEPLTVWARPELRNPDASLGTLGIATQHLSARRRAEVHDPSHEWTKYSENEVKISYLLKKRDQPPVEPESDSDDDSDDDEVPVPIRKIDDTSFIILCLAPADDVLYAVKRIRELSSNMSTNSYGKAVSDAVDALPQLESLRNKWHFHRRFVPHNLRSTYIAYLYWMLGESGNWPKGDYLSECIAKYLGHGTLNSTTSYQRVTHVPTSAPVPAHQQEDNETEERDETEVCNESDQNDDLEIARLELAVAQAQLDLKKRMFAMKKRKFEMVV